VQLLEEFPAWEIVDDSNPIPKYLQISTWLKELIQTGLQIRQKSAKC